MSLKDTAANTATNTVTSRSIIPFTGGLIIFVYAWFWPEGYGHWVGSIVHAFRQSAGF